MTSQGAGRTVRYRDRIYQRYASTFKGRPRGNPAVEFERHARQFDHLLGPVAARLRPRKILDVACGQGPILFWARSRKIGEAHGVDVSEEQVEVARSLGLSAEVADALDYLERCTPDIDLITAFDIIEHFDRDEALAFLDGCLKCLRPGGALVLTTPNGSGLRPGPVVYGDLTHETIFSPDTITLALKLAGFERVSVREIVPPATTMRSRVRRVLWRAIRLSAMLLDAVEKGSSSGIYSRVMVVEAWRPKSAA